GRRNQEHQPRRRVPPDLRGRDAAAPEGRGRRLRTLLRHRWLPRRREQGRQPGAPRPRADGLPRSVPRGDPLHRERGSQPALPGPSGLRHHRDGPHGPRHGQGRLTGGLAQHVPDARRGGLAERGPGLV
ncbi:hypothetical protein SVEN_0288, partial [Streptomyces venezuelae ATCC 10712]